MTQEEEMIEVLNDLILINNDRISVYEKSLKKLTAADTDLYLLFNKSLGHSQTIVTELKEQIHLLGGTPGEGTMLTGKLYRIWMDIKASFRHDERLALLKDVEVAEKAAQKAYESAICCEDLSLELKDLLAGQKAVLLYDSNTVFWQKTLEKVGHERR